MASLVEVVAIRGGGINLESPLMHAWVVKPVMIAGRRFVPIYTRDYRCQQRFENNFRMVHHITKLRNDKVMVSMSQLAAEDDPNEDNPVLQGMPSRPKKVLIDQLPEVLLIKADTQSGLEAAVHVLPSWLERGVLNIELNQENMDLLLESPPAASACPFVPGIGQPNVSWVKEESQPCSLHLLG